MGPFLLLLILFAALGPIEQVRLKDEASFAEIKLLDFLRLILKAYEICSLALGWTIGVHGAEPSYR